MTKKAKLNLHDTIGLNQINQTNVFALFVHLALQVIREAILFFITAHWQHSEVIRSHCDGPFLHDGSGIPCRPRAIAHADCRIFYRSVTRPRNAQSEYRTLPSNAKQLYLKISALPGESFFIYALNVVRHASASNNIS